MLTHFGPLDLRGERRIGLQTARAPGRELLWIQSLAPAIVAQLRLVESGRLHHDGEFLLAAELTSGRRGHSRALGVFAGFGAPTIEGVLRDLCLISQIRHIGVIRWQHLGNDARFEFRRISCH
jgi:hypothetical protein